MKRRTALILVLLMLAGLAAGCSDSGSGSTPPAGDTSTTPPGGSDTAPSTEAGVKSLTLASLEWQAVDTYQITGTAGFQGLAMDTLLIYQPEDGTYIPSIAESYTLSEDGKTLTFTIPTDYKFHDGTPLTPEDIKRSYEWGMEISPYKEDYASIESIEIQGNDLIIHMEAFSSATIFSIAGGFMPIIPAAQLDSMSAEELLWGARPYGPFYLEEYVEGSHVTLKRNEYYKTHNPKVKNKGPMNVETVTVRFISDDFAMSNSVVAGEIDATGDYSSLMVSELSKNPDIAYEWQKDFQVTRMLLNNDYELFEDPNIREAIMLLVDRDGLAEYAEGVMRPAYAYSVSGMTDYSKEAEDYIESHYRYNPDKALQILADAGWADTDGDGYLDKDGTILSFTMNHTSGPFTKILVEYLQVRYREHGVRMELQNLERPLFNAAVKTDDNYHAALSNFSWGDTAATLPYLVTDKNILADDTYFTLCYEAGINADAGVRVEKFAEAQKILADSRCSIPIVRRNSLFVYNTVTMADLVTDEYGSFYLNDIK